MRITTTIGLLLLLAGAVVAVTVWWDREGEPGETKPVMWRIDTADVSTFELRHIAGVSRRFERQGDGWSEGDNARIDAALLLLAAPEAVRRLPPDGNATADYGLDPPLLEIALGGPDTTTTIKVGDATPDGSQRYVHRDGDDAVFLVAKSWFEALMLLLPDAKAAR
ncbi:MAG: DUF4340 domain-containing protein [Minwuia sp.]|uniref:DUF4340 domain-containing protein n=1 Tax=Minwuia sp. TaxID=2493630 RepID=UPI003A88C07D